MEQAMSQSPFINDPRDLMTSSISAAVLAGQVDVAAIHIDAARHMAELAEASGLTRAGRAASAGCPSHASPPFPFTGGINWLWLFGPARSWIEGLCRR